MKPFKKNIDVSINIILKELYTVKNARRHRKLREYAFKILWAVKFAKLKSIFNQIAIIYNNLNIEFRRDLTKSINVKTLKKFLKKMNNFKKIQWQLIYGHFKNYKDVFINKDFQKRNYESRKSFYFKSRNFFRIGKYFKQYSKFYS